MNKYLWYFGIVIFCWVTYSLGANIWEYFELKNYFLLFVTFITNLASFFWIGHCLFFNDKSRNPYQVACSTLLILLYAHFFVFSATSVFSSVNEYLGELRTVVYGGILVFLICTYPFKSLLYFIKTSQISRFDHDHIN